MKTRNYGKDNRNLRTLLVLETSCFSMKLISPFRSWHATQTLSRMKCSNLVLDIFMICSSEQELPILCLCNAALSSWHTMVLSHWEWAHTGAFLRQVYPDVTACAQGMEWSLKLMNRSVELRPLFKLCSGSVWNHYLLVSMSSAVAHQSYSAFIVVSVLSHGKTNTQICS